MRAFRQGMRPLAYVLSLFVLASALWMPSAVAQTLPGSPFQGGGGSGSVGGATPIVMNDDVAIIWGTGSDSSCEYDTLQTPDATVCGVGQDSRVWWFNEANDAADYALAQQTNPTVAIHSAATTAAQYLTLTHDQTNASINTGVGGYITSSAGINRMLLQGLPKNLTESAATPFVRVAVAAGTIAGGTVIYAIQASDAVDVQALSGNLVFSVVNKGGVETCTLSTAGAANEAVAVSAGTLTNTFTCDTAPANAVDISANAVSSLTQTTLSIGYSVVKHNGTGQISAQ
jgi:hypothetical protein